MSSLSNLQNQTVNRPVVNRIPFVSTSNLTDQQKRIQKLTFRLEMAGWVALSTVGLACLCAVSLPASWTIVVAVVTLLAISAFLIQIKNCINESRVKAADLEKKIKEIEGRDVYQYNNDQYRDLDSLKKQIESDLGERSRLANSFVRIDNQMVLSKEGFYQELEAVLMQKFPELKEQQEKFKNLLANLPLTSFTTINDWIQANSEKKGVKVKEFIGKPQITLVDRNENGQDFVIKKTVSYQVQEESGFRERQITLVYSSEPSFKTGFYFLDI